MQNYGKKSVIAEAVQSKTEETMQTAHGCSPHFADSEFVPYFTFSLFRRWQLLIRGLVSFEMIAFHDLSGWEISAVTELREFGGELELY